MLFNALKKTKAHSKANSTDIGSAAETKASNYLTTQGLSIVEQNFSAKTGEIDIIALDKDVLVFVEVKFRRSAQFGQPYETVTYRKQQKIIRTAQGFLQRHKKYANNACRFDIISILNSEITWLKNAFE